MNIKELRITLNKLNVNKRELSFLLGYNKTYFSSLSSRKKQSDSIPKHIETIVNLLYIMKINNIDYLTKLEVLNKRNNKNISLSDF